MSDLKFIDGKWYDFGCKNESFLLTAKELKTLGIKNYYFMLRIDNPRVADIDPWNPHITRQEVELLMNEFKHNMWSFIRMAVRLRTQKGVVPYGLHRGLAAALWCFERHQDFCLCEPRQTWKSSGLVGGPIQWAFQLSQNLTMHFFGKDSDNTKNNLSSLKDDIALLPEWCQFIRYMDDAGKIKKARQSTEILQNNLFHNRLEIHPKPASFTHAQSLGRGGSGAIVYYDEIEHTPYAGEIISNSAPLFKTSAENAAASGQPYCRIFSCTPGDLDTNIGKEALPIIKSMIPWSEKIYDMTPAEIALYKSAYEDEYHADNENKSRDVMDVFYMEYHYWQVRKDYAWVKDQYKLSGDKRAVKREILMQRLRGSSTSPIDPEDLEYLIANMKKSDRDLIINGKWRFLLYDHGQGMRFGLPKELDETIPYIVGVDPAGGGGGDNIAITIVNPYNLQVAAEFKNPYIGLTPLVNLLVTLIEDYIPRAVITIEKNSMGTYLIQALVDHTSIKDNLYWSEKEANKQIQDMASESPADNELRELAMQYKKYGTYNSGPVRKAMFEILFRHIKECREILNTEYLVDDICKLDRNPNTGKIAALKGEHDDCLMSYLHAMYIYYNGDNLEHFGIVRREHPILGNFQDDWEERLEERYPDMGGYFSTDEVVMSYDEEVMQDAARLEGEIQEIVGALSFVHDDVYSKRVSTDSDELVDIGAHFFDQMNGL